MNEIKPHLSYKGQINKLRGKGCIIDDDSFCRDVLVNIGYYQFITFMSDHIGVRPPLRFLFREGQAQIIVNLHKNGFTPEQIASATNKTLEDVNDILFSKDETHCS